MADDFEKCAFRCKTLKQLRDGCLQHKNNVAESLSQPKELLNSILKRLQLHGRKFEVFQSASESEIDDFWEILLLIDASLTKNDTTKSSLQKFTALNEFMSHCCTFRKYSVSIKKCGKIDCSMCGNVNMPLDVFSGL